MAKHPWLSLRGSVWYLRAPVPKDIRESYRKAEVTFSLRTTDRATANRLIHAKAKAVADHFEAHRKLKVASPASATPALSPTTPLDPVLQQRLCDGRYQQMIDEDFVWRSEILKKMRADEDGFIEGKYIKHPTSEWYLTFFGDFSLEEALVVCFREDVRARQLAIEHALQVGDRAAGEEVADEALANANIVITNSDRLVLVRRLMETENDALKAILARDRARYEAILARWQQPNQTTQNVQAATAQPAADPGPLLSELMEGFQKEGTVAGRATKTTQSDQTDLREFINIAGDLPIRTYAKQHGTKFKETLLKTPRQRKTQPFAGLSIAEAAKLATKLDPDGKSIPRLHVDTINDKLMAVRKFFRWADGQYSNVFNPIDGLRIQPKKASGKRSQRRLKFNADELNKLFNGPIYTGCGSSPRDWKHSGTHIPRDSARFWAPLIGLFSGMRLGEIIQLRVNDIKTDPQGITYFEITTLVEEDADEADKSLKNANSERQIPVHPMLWACGLQTLIDKQKRAGHPRLLMDYDRSPVDDSWSKTFSAWFRQYRQHVGVERVIAGRNRVDFHSFRHLFEDVARNLPGIKYEVRNALQGHGENGVSQEYGTGVYRSTLAEAMKLISYPELDLSHIVVCEPEAVRKGA